MCQPVPSVLPHVPLSQRVSPGRMPVVYAPAAGKIAWSAVTAHHPGNMSGQSGSVAQVSKVVPDPHVLPLWLFINLATQRLVVHLLAGLAVWTCVIPSLVVVTSLSASNLLRNIAYSFRTKRWTGIKRAIIKIAGSSTVRCHKQPAIRHPLGHGESGSYNTCWSGRDHRPRLRTIGQSWQETWALKGGTDVMSLPPEVRRTTRRD